MIKIEEGREYKDEYVQCCFCLFDNTETTIYRIIVGKTERQTTTLKLCRECLRELRDKIMEI